MRSNSLHSFVRRSCTVALLVAALCVVQSFALAEKSTEQTPDKPVAAPSASQRTLALVPGTNTPKDAPSVTLRHQVAPNAELRYKTHVQQDLHLELPPAKPHDVQSDIQAQMQWKSASTATASSMPLEVVFRDFEVKLRSGDKVLPGEAYLSQLGVLRLSMALDAQGKISNTVMDGNNPQVIRTLNLFQDAFLRSIPVFPSKPVQVGDSWVNQETFKTEKTPALSSQVSRTYKLDKVEKRSGAQVAVLSSTLRILLESEAEIDGEPRSKISYTVEGKGEVVFSIEEGQILSSTFSATQASKPSDSNDKSVHRSKIKILWERLQ